MAPDELSPKPGHPHQANAAAAAADAPTPVQAAWLRFVERVERGEIVDPSGQYVAKGTPGVVAATGQRLTRLKFDAATAAFSQHFQLKKNGKDFEVIALSPEAGAKTLPDDVPCDGCGPGGPGVQSTFITSENQGGTGYIHDLKLIVGAPGDNSTSEQTALGAGYTKLNSDLNKGAGGAYIYLAFQRNSAQVLNGVEYTYNYAYSGPNEILTAFQTQYGTSTAIPNGDAYFYHIWVPNQNPNIYWGRLNLNQGAAGDYIYSFQSKNPVVSNYLYISEIGILSGNSSTILPPAGWRRDNRDLNEGAGGDYIYFCYR